MTEADPAETAATDRTYLCPYCRASYPTEMLARVHVSHADDAAHANRDGMTPEVEPVECVDDERVGSAFTRAGQLNLHGLGLSDMPERYAGRTFSERERRALLVAAFNANKGLAATELQDLVAAHLSQCGFEPLAVDRLRRLCEHVFAPHADRKDADGTTGDGEIRTAETTLRDLTALQQAIVLAHVARPDADRAQLARQVGTARSYPGQVIDARSDLVARLRSRVEATSIERVVAERVPADSLAEIREEGYLDAFDIDLEAARERKRRHTDPGRAVAAGVEGAGQSPPTPERDGDDPSSDRALADRGGADDGGDGGDAGDDIEADSGTGAAPGGDGDTGRPSGDADEMGATPEDGNVRDAIPRSEVESVREQVAFDLAVVEQEMALADPTPQQVRTKAHLQQILERLDAMLAGGTRNESNDPPAGTDRRSGTDSE